MVKFLVVAAAALLGTAVWAQAADMPPQNPANMPESPPPAAPAKDEASVKQDLVAAGFTDPQNLMQTETGWTGTALHKGKRVKVRIGADGKVAYKPL